MAIDARLADVTILALAAKRAKAHQTTTASRPVVLRTVYYNMLDGTEEEGPTYEYPPLPEPGGRA
jgi:hypothetical protein